MFDPIEAGRRKGEIQLEAVDKSIIYDNLLLSWATGVSKTKAVIDIIEQDFIHTDILPKSYIIVKETNHEFTWREEFKKWKREYLLENITFFCYASLHKYIDDKVDFLILDECHALSEMREDYLKTIKCDKIISLSATVTEPIKKRIRNYKEGFYEFHISLQDAIDRGILPKPAIYVAYIDLDNKEKKYNWPTKEKKVATLTAKSFYERLEKKIAMWHKKYAEEGHEWAYNKWIQEMSNRKHFMARAKTDAAKKLLENLKDKKYICFTGSIEQVKELGGGKAIHSKIGKEQRQEIIDSFNAGRSNHIYAVNMLREAMNLKDIEAAVIVQLDNQKGSFHQMVGRSLRSIAPEVYILVLRDTRDEDYLEVATKDISSQYITNYIWPEVK